MMYNYMEIIRFCLGKITILRKLGRGARPVSVSLLRYYASIYVTHWNTKDTFAIQF